MNVKQTTEKVNNERQETKPTFVKRVLGAQLKWVKFGVNRDENRYKFFQNYEKLIDSKF